MAEKKSESEEKNPHINILYFDRWTVFIFDNNLYLVELLCIQFVSIFNG